MSLSDAEWQVLRDRFDPAWYLARHADVLQAGLDPWAHFTADGHCEGRHAIRCRALELDHLLWRGRAAQALPDLAALARGRDPLERTTAAWVLARWQAAEGDWPAARAALEGMQDGAEARFFVPHAGPELLGLRADLACGDPDAAAARIAAAAGRPGLVAADLALSRVAVAASGGTHDHEIIRLLGEIHFSQELPKVSLWNIGKTEFDRLSARPDKSIDGPLVSVIVPVHDAAATLGQALRGLLAQEWRALEILVVDDASGDDSAAIAEVMGDPRIRVLRQARNQGAYPARNAGLNAARGELITVHDADDWSHPSKIRLQAEALLEAPEAVASLSHWARLDEDLGPALWRIDTGWVHRNVSSLMIRASLRDSLGYWDRVRVNADTEYYHRILAAHGPEAVIEVRPGLPLAFGRSSPTALTMRPETHLRSQFAGPRRDYLDAARVWHASGGSLHLPQHPERRPFAAPPETGPQDPPGEPSDFELVRAAPLFDRDWYLDANEDVLMADTPPALHYIQGGGAEGRDPGPLFSSSAYAHVHGTGPGTPPLLHHLRSGGEGDGLFGFPGALDGSAPRVLVFAHAAGRAVFGAERSYLDMLARLAAEGLAPVAVLPSFGSAAYLEAVRAVSAQVEILPQRWRRMGRDPHPASIAAARALIRRHGARVVHVNTLVLDAPLAAARAEGVETVVHVRELLSEDPALCRILGGSAEEIRAALLGEADRLVANSPLVSNWIGAPDRTDLRLNAVEDALFDLPFAPARDALRVALVSSNVAKKGLDDAIAAARRVGEVSDRVRFVLIGPDSPDLGALRPLPDNVTLAGYAESPMAAMEQADVVLSLSHFAESFGRTVLEAMAAGRPVICYDRGTPPWLVGRGAQAGGIVVAPDRPFGVARAILAFEAARHGLGRMSARARGRARAFQAEARRPGAQNPHFATSTP